MRFKTLLLPILFWSPLAAADPAPVFAEVATLEGLASLEPEHTNLRLGQKLAEGSRITVMSGSSVSLKLHDGVAVRAGPNSELVLERGPNRLPQIRLIHGSLLSALKPEPESKRERYRVKAHKVSLGVRGTEFFVRQDLNRPTFLCVCSGEVHAKWDKGELSLHSTKKHEHHIDIRPSRKKAQKTNEMGKDHDDKQLEALQKLL